VILAINGVPAADADPAAIVPEDAGEVVPVRLRVRRATGEESDFTVQAPVKRIPQIGILPYHGNRVDRVARDGPAASLFRPGDEILSVNDRPVRDLGLLPEEVGAASDRLERIGIRRDGEARTLVPEAPLTVADLLASIGAPIDFASTRITPRPTMPAYEAGMLPGDRVVEVDGARTDDWREIQKAVQKAGTSSIEVVVDRGGEKRSFRIQPVSRAAGLGSYGYEFAAVMEMHRETSVPGAVAIGWRRTVTMMKQVLLTLKSLVTRRVSVENIGGPILLARVTYAMFDLGWGQYLMILALISINLAVLNLLPIPVLDGGQIVLLCAEKLRGRPLPERLVGYFQLAGLVMILGLMVLAFHNDIARILE
jgi:regulator of sigma E protease